MPPRPVSVIIPNLDGAHLLRPCLQSLQRQSFPAVEVIVVDGASRDGSRELVRAEFPHVRLVALNRNLGFAGNVNAGLRTATGDPLLLLNNDAEAEARWVEACVAALASDPRLGAVASKMLYQDGQTLNSAGDSLTVAGRPLQRGNGQPDGAPWDSRAHVFGASGGAATYRRAMLEDVGLFDEAFFMYLEDVDLAFRAQLRGWSCLYEPSARVYHRGSATGGGVLASYYNGRNGIRLLAKNVPSTLLPRLLRGLTAHQARRAREALAGWRGSEARATLRGQLMGLLALPGYGAARRAVQQRRRISDQDLLSRLSPDPG